MTTGYPNKRARTQRALIRGAMRVMADHRGASLSAAAVCRAAEVSHGTFYNYFDSVEALEVAVAAELLEVFELGATNLARLSGDPAARVALGVQQLLAMPSLDHVYATAFLEVMSGRRDFRAHVRDIVLLEVQKGVARGAFDTPSEVVATDALLGAILQTIRSMLHDEADDNPEAVVEVCLRLLGVPAAQIAAVATRAVARV